VFAFRHRHRHWFQLRNADAETRQRLLQSKPLVQVSGCVDVDHTVDVQGTVDVGNCLRDLTRGGLTSASNEIATASGRAIHLREAAIPVREEVRGACELLGLDPFSVANEGRFIAIIDRPDAERALKVLRRHAIDTSPARIGDVLESGPARVTIEGRIGCVRILDMPSGEQLPRIC
jgi:hydrogenase maturation factor